MNDTENKKDLLNRIQKEFNSNRPEHIVDNPTSCLDCEEAYKKHLGLKKLKYVMPDDFNVTGISMYILNDQGFWYYFPRVLTLCIEGKEITIGVYEGYLLEMTLNILIKCNDRRFDNIGKLQYSIIIDFLKFIYKKYYMEDYEYWDYNTEKIIHAYYNETIIEKCSKALSCWKLKNW
jgi:hypothetical protein